MTCLGNILFASGCAAAVAGDFRLLVLAYRAGFGWFLGCLFFPVAAWIFFILHARETWRPVSLSLAGVVLAGIGYHIGGFDFLS
jgi:hypothetical protein